MISQC